MIVLLVDSSVIYHSKHLGCHLVNLIDKSVYRGIFIFSTHSKGSDELSVISAFH